MRGRARRKWEGVRLQQVSPEAPLAVPLGLGRGEGPARQLKAAELPQGSDLIFKALRVVRRLSHGADGAGKKVVAVPARSSRVNAQHLLHRAI